MEQAKQTFLAFFRREKLLKWVVALGLCGMALIYLSSATREKLVTAVCTALDLSSAKVCVVSGG